MNKLVSVIMNCKNGEKYLTPALKSIINQKYINWELIFVDNNSKDQTKDIFFSFDEERFKYFFLDKDQTLGFARQYALSNCSGEFIAFLDCDDLWKENKLEKQIPLFEDNSVGMVISNTIFFSEYGERIFYKKSPKTGDVFFDLLKNYFINLETLICRKKFIENINFRFNSDFEMISDFELCINLSTVSKLAYVDEPLSKWRVHSDSDTWNKEHKFYLEKINFINNYKKFKDNKDFKKVKKIFIKKNYLLLVILNFKNNKKKFLDIVPILNNFTLSKEFFICLILFLFPFAKNFIDAYKKRKNNFKLK